MQFPQNSMDENCMHPEIKFFRCSILNLRTCTIVIHTIFWKFSKLRLTSTSGPIASATQIIIGSQTHYLAYRHSCTRYCTE